MERNSTINQTAQLTINHSANQADNSPWLLIRLIIGLKNAIEEQSTPLDSPSKRFNGFMNYFISPYAAICIFMAILLNRTVVFASSRNHKNLPLLSKIILRSISIFLLGKNLVNILVALKFYNNFEWIPSYFKYDAFYYQNTFMACNTKDNGPTPNLFWPLYLSLCFSQFIETFISVTSGQLPYSESGLTLFEHSLAFQEVAYTLKPTNELLLVSFISITNQLSIQFGGVFSSNKYRLIPSSILGILFLSFYIYSIVNNSVLNFPIIIIIGYLPQVLILGIILLCGSIFVLAILFKGSIHDLNFSSFINLNSENYNIHLYDDFYTALMNLGLLSITSAGKSSYVKEISLLYVRDKTWLENEFEENRIGYDKSILNPPISNFNSNRREANSIENKSVIGRRVFYLAKTFRWSFQLIKSIIFNRERLPSFLSAMHRSRQHEIKFRENGQEVADGPNIHEISIDEIDDELLTSNYAKYLMSNFRLSEVDSSLNYIEQEEDQVSQSEIESDSEAEDYSKTLTQRKRTPAHVKQEMDKHYEDDLINELISTREFQELVNPSSEQEEFFKLMKYHMNYSPNTRLTRSKFKKMTETTKNEKTLLFDLLKEQRTLNSDDNDDYELTSKLCCVVCHVNPREIILWPCRCFAVCESCRVSLVVRGFSGCICCRRDVEGFTKVFIP